MRKAWFAVVLFAACGGDDEESTMIDPDIPVESAFVVDEGGTLDLVIHPSATATVMADALPANATIEGQRLSFQPDFTQAGIYSIVLTVTVDGVVSTRTIGIRVHDVIHLAQPAVVNAYEGASATPVTFTSTNLPGTVLVYSADLSAAPGATFDPLTGTVNFKPGFRWRDTRPDQITIPVTVTGNTLDTGTLHSSTVPVIYKINEVTSWSDELLPEFATHNCPYCHDPNGGLGTFAALDMTEPGLRARLVNVAVAPDGVNNATCGTLAASGVKLVVPNMPSKSLLYMKIAGTDGATTPTPPCGVQMPNNQAEYLWTVTDQFAWDACTIAPCREALLCADDALSCKVESMLVKKLRIWIEAGALDN